MRLRYSLLLFLLLSVISNCKVESATDDTPNLECEKSSTKFSGKYALTHNESVCTGTLIFEEDFDSLNNEKWEHENTLSGNGNWEFQWYTNNRTNSYVENGVLYIRPTLLSDQFGEEFLSRGTLNINGGAPADVCTNSAWYGCERVGTPMNLINPIKSARIRTVNSFKFRYGKVEVKAMMPLGDWLWPAIWLLPAQNAYGSWPASGEIDLVESRGNKNYEQDGQKIGVTRVSSTLHFGPYSALNGWTRAYFNENDLKGFNEAFKKYQLEWTPNHIKFSIDDKEIGKATPPAEGFWQYGDFENAAPKTDNPWKSGTKMAPFDQEFYLIINLAVGGTNFFPDDAENPDKKPWKNNSTMAMKEFYDYRSKWLKTWNYDKNNGKSSSLQVDYVKVWAL